MVKTKTVGYEVASLGGSYLLFKNIEASMEKSKEIMDIIVEQFENSGAQDIEYSGQAITNFQYNVTPEKMDFSSIPELFMTEGVSGFYTAIGSAGIGLIAGLLAAKYSDNIDLKGLIKTGRRLGEAYGLAKIVGAMNGLDGLNQFTINSPAYIPGKTNLIGFSQDDFISSIDIAPAVQNGLKTLSNYFKISLSAAIIVELVSEIIEYKNSPSTPSKAVKEFKGDESLGTDKQGPWDSNVKFIL